MSDPRPLVSTRHPLVSLLYIFCSVCVGYLTIGLILGMVAADWIYGGNYAEAALKTEWGPNFATASLVFQLITSACGFILFPLLHLRLVEHRPVSAFFPRQGRLGEVLLAVVLLALAFTVAMSPITEWNKGIHFPEFMRGFEEWAKQSEAQAEQITRALLVFNNAGELMLVLLVVAIVPGIGEELLFRGLIQRELWRGSGNVHVAIWTSAILFSAIHMQFYGFVPRMLLGALFGYLYYWSDNLLVPMFAHFLNNGLAVILIYLYDKDMTSLNPEATDNVPWPWVLVCLAVAVGLLYFIRSHYRKHPPRSTLPPNVAAG